MDSFVSRPKAPQEEHGKLENKTSLAATHHSSLSKPFNTRVVDYYSPALTENLAKVATDHKPQEVRNGLNGALHEKFQGHVKAYQKYS